MLDSQDTKLSNAAAWGNLGSDEEDGQKANDDEEDNADGLWNNFQSRDDVERVEVIHYAVIDVQGQLAIDWVSCGTASMHQ